MDSPPPPLDSPRDHALLLTVLCEATGIETTTQPISTLVEQTSTLGDAAESLGLRLSPVRGTITSMAPLARPDLPLVCWTETGECWIFDGAAPGRFRVAELHNPTGKRWRSQRSLNPLLGTGVLSWYLVERALPVAALASTDKAKSPFKRLVSLLWLERHDASLVVLYGVITGLFSLATPLAIQVLINWLAFGALAQPILLLGGFLLTCLSFAAVLLVVQRRVIETLERRIFVRMVSDLSTRISRVKTEAFDGLNGPEMANHFFDVLTLQKAVSSLLLDGFTAALQVVVAVTLLALYNPWLLVFDLFLLIGMFVVIVPLGVGAQSTAIKESKAKYAVASWIEEIARHPVALRMNHAHLAEAKAEDLARTWLYHRQNHFRVVIRQFTGVQIFQVVASVVLLMSTGMLVLYGQLTIGQLVAAEFIVTSAMMGLTKFAGKLDVYYDLLAGIDKLGTLLDLPIEAPTGLGLQSEKAAEIELVDVRLRRHDGHISAPIQLRLPPGSRTTLRGPPGSGKRTLAEVIAGLRSPHDGTVRRNGRSIAQLRPRARYGGVSLIRNDDLLHASLRENITLGRPDIDDTLVFDALATVGLQSRVEDLGLETRIAPSGYPLTEVEQRALLIARAIVARPTFLIADSVLDGLPTEPRERLHSCLFDANTPWTLLLLTADTRVTSDPARTHHLCPEGLS